MELILDSLRRRMRAMHSLWEDAVATMDVDQVNHVEREPVLPIAFSLFHFVQIEDGSATMLGAGPMVYDDSWAERMGLAHRRPRQAPHGRRDGRPAHRGLRRVQGVHGRRVRQDRDVAGGARPGDAHRGDRGRGRSRRRSRRRTAPASPARPVSPASTPPSAGSTSTACATWARSSTPAPWSGCRE